MSKPAARLLAWLSPAFPVGSFAYSGGLESAIAHRRITDSTATQNWIEGSLKAGSALSDAVVLKEAWEAGANAARLCEITDFCLALIASSERRLETLQTGTAFVAAARAWPDPVFDLLPAECPYPVAVGAMARAQGLALDETLATFLTSLVQAQISVAVRLVPIGQTDGLRILAALEPAIDDAAAYAEATSIDSLLALGYASDIETMRHETLTTRIFRS